MKTLLLFCASCVFALPVVRAQGASPAAQGETELGGKMDEMNGAFRKLRKQVADPAMNASSLEAVAVLRAGAEASAKLVPAKAAAVPEAEREKFVAAYAAKMAEFLSEVAKLEAALKANDQAGAEAAVGQLMALHREGHREFRPAKKKE